jgi:hypothetical protein
MLQITEFLIVPPILDVPVVEVRLEHHKDNRQELRTRFQLWQGITTPALAA